MKSEKDKNPHVTFRAPVELVSAVAGYCKENDETPSQFWRKAARLRLSKEKDKSGELNLRPITRSAGAGAPAVGSGDKACPDGKHCKKAVNS